MSLLPAHHFDNRFVRELPGDSDQRNIPRQVHGAAWSFVSPTPVPAPKVIASSKAVLKLFDLAPQDAQTPQFANVFGGNEVLPGMQPYAACYGGHQFGTWAGQLGDGRAIVLGEYLNQNKQRWELQLKGAGPTPYSRSADGRAVLRSSLREYLCSEAMHALGVPTTRALSLVLTGEPVLRDMLYDGNARLEPGAVVCRVAPSFIRFGNFEIFSSRREWDLLEKLVDFTIDRDFAQLKEAPNRRAEWFKEVCRRTAQLMVQWMRVGFVHGVMNTDNMSILGLTIDYGPYGWVDDYDPGWTPNTTDSHTHRYAFGRQPQIAHWNLTCLANALVPVFKSADELGEGLEAFKREFTEGYLKMTDAKFGFSEFADENINLAEQAFELMHQGEVDMTCFFRDLARVNPDAPDIEILNDAFYDADARKRSKVAWEDWLKRYAKRIQSQKEDPVSRVARMNAANPRYVLRNYMAQEAIDLAEAGDFSRIEALMEVLSDPYIEKEKYKKFAEKRPEWAREKVGCSMLSCSS